MPAHTGNGLAESALPMSQFVLCGGLTVSSYKTDRYTALV